MNQVPLATLMASMRDADYNADVITSYVNASAVTLGAFVENGSVTRSRVSAGSTPPPGSTPAPRPA